LNTQPLGFSVKADDELVVDKENLHQYINAQDLKQFGLIPELIGRLPIVTHLNPLTTDILKSILTDPKNALIKQYTKLFDMENKELVFTDDALDYIVEKALDFQLGARGLRSICEVIMMDAMFEIPSDTNTKTITIDKEYAQKEFEKSKFKKLKVA